MRLARAIVEGRYRPAIIDRQAGLRDLSSIVDEIAGDTLRPPGLLRLRGIMIDSLPPLPPDTPLGPPMGSIGKIIGVGLNYRDHAAETGLKLPSEPTLFLKPGSAIAGPVGPVYMPQDGAKLDWEVELGVVIGEPGTYIAEAQAFDHVAGYCLGIDFSERAFQFDRGGQGFKGKSSDSFAPLGPYLVTADEIPDPQQLQLQLAVNGQRRQNGSTSEMIFSVAALVAYISRFMSLHSGDVILTGTPAGVGMGLKPPSYLIIGDVVLAQCNLLGAQEHVVTALG